MHALSASPEGIFVEKLEVADPRHYRPQIDLQPHQTAAKDKKSYHHDYPDNYETCWDVFRVVKRGVITIGNLVYKYTNIKHKFCWNN